jgi:hypothetical protein
MRRTWLIPVVLALTACSSSAPDTAPATSTTTTMIPVPAVACRARVDCRTVQFTNLGANLTVALHPNDTPIVISVSDPAMYVCPPGERSGVGGWPRSTGFTRCETAGTDRSVTLPSTRTDMMHLGISVRGRTGGQAAVTYEAVDAYFMVFGEGGTAARFTPTTSTVGANRLNASRVIAGDVEVSQAGTELQPAEGSNPAGHATTIYDVRPNEPVTAQLPTDGGMLIEWT